MVEKALIRAGVPCEIAGSRAFFDKPAVRAALAYMRLALNEADDAALLECINVPPRGLGDKALAALRSAAAGASGAAAGRGAAAAPTLARPLLGAARALAAGRSLSAVALGASPRRALRGFVDLIERIFAAAAAGGAPAMVRAAGAALVAESAAASTAASSPPPRSVSPPLSSVPRGTSAVDVPSQPAAKRSPVPVPAQRRGTSGALATATLANGGGGFATAGAALRAAEESGGVTRDDEDGTGAPAPRKALAAAATSSRELTAKEKEHAEAARALAALAELASDHDAMLAAGGDVGGGDRDTATTSGLAERAARFLDDVGLASAGPADLEEDGDGASRGGGRVTLCTIHKAKGLEWDVVFLVGAHDGGLPTRARGEHDEASGRLPRARDGRALARADDAHRDEERRLFHVAITRARRALVLTNAARGPPRGDDNTADEQRPSPFIELLPRSAVVHEERRADAVGSGAARAAPPDERAAPAAPPPLPPPCTLVSAAFAPRPRCTGHDIAAAIVWEDRPPLASQDEADVGTGAGARRRVCVCGLPRARACGYRELHSDFVARSTRSATSRFFGATAVPRAAGKPPSPSPLALTDGGNARAGAAQASAAASSEAAAVAPSKPASTKGPRSAPARGCGDAGAKPLSSFFAATTLTKGAAVPRSAATAVPPAAGARPSSVPSGAARRPGNVTLSGVLSQRGAKPSTAHAKPRGPLARFTVPRATSAPASLVRPAKAIATGAQSAINAASTSATLGDGAASAAATLLAAPQPAAPSPRCVHGRSSECAECATISHRSKVLAELTARAQAVAVGTAAAAVREDPCVDGQSVLASLVAVAAPVARASASPARSAAAPVAAAVTSVRPDPSRATVVERGSEDDPHVFGRSGAGNAAASRARPQRRRRGDATAAGGVTSAGPQHGTSTDFVATSDHASKRARAANAARPFVRRLWTALVAAIGRERDRKRGGGARGGGRARVPAPLRGQRQMSQFLAGSTRADQTNPEAVEKHSTKIAVADKGDGTGVSPLGEIDTNAGGPAPLKRSKRSAD